MPNHQVPALQICWGNGIVERVTVDQACAIEEWGEGWTLTLAEAHDWVTCGTCGRVWADDVVTGWTPAPSARCPFEYDHEGSY